MNTSISTILESTGLEPKLIEEIVTTGRLKKVKAGQVIVSPDEPGNEMPIVMSGLLKVLRRNPDGNEVFLYYLEGGETCAMSITCCIEGKRASFKVVAEEDATMWMIPMHNMDSWVAKYQSFRKFVFASYQTRFDELLSTIDSVVFHKMDERVYRYLLDTKQATGSFEINKLMSRLQRNSIAQELWYPGWSSNSKKKEKSSSIETRLKFYSRSKIHILYW